ncbi:ATP-binding cassette domain-containing protein, partial [Actinotalea sp. AC32]|nr:ATP-binding cassette domain-containing protein [Actinotalea sp. AC32]
VDRLRDADARTAHAADDGARPASLAAALQPAATGTAVLAALVLGAHATAAGTLAPVELAVVVLTPLAVFEAVALLPAAALQVLRSRAAAERVMALLEPATTADDGVLPGPAAPGTGSHVEGPTPDPGSAAGPADGSSSAPGRERPVADAPRGPRLVARGADVGWPGGPTLVRGLDLELSPGRSVAVVGPSGLGKTTLLLTLAGLLRPHAGHVTLDGVDVADLGRPEAARSVVVVPEDAHVFDTTVLENLRVARGDVTAAEATSTLEAVGLGAWLDALPDGLATVLGADATRVSGGERRRLLLARALLSRAPLLLLDEPTEHVDAAGDDLMTALLDGSLAPGRGVVVVTHRTGGLDAADEVIALARTGSVSRARPRPRDGAARDRDAAQAARPAGPTA